MKPLTAASLRFIAGAHRSEAASRRQSPLIFQRDFAAVLEGWAADADARADALDAAVQPDLFGAAA